MKRNVWAGAMLISSLAAGAAAEQVFSENVIVDGALCVGTSCQAGEPGLTTMRIKSGIADIEFMDVSPSTYPDRDWRIQINETGLFGREWFAVADDTAGTIPFAVEGDAPTASMFLDGNGFLGLGTSEPTAKLHLLSGISPTLRIEQDGSNGNDLSGWDFIANHEGFILKDFQTGLIPFWIKPSEGNSNIHAVVIAPGGFVGHGTDSPETGLHLWRPDGNAQVFVEDVYSVRGARALLKLHNNGRPDIVMANIATGGEWAFGAGTNFVLKNGAVGSSDGEKDLQLKLYGATGNLEIAGQIITGGGICGGGCDAVFSEDYDLPTIREHGAAMFALGHLPNVGPTREGAPINVSDKLGRMLNELEHAHIYILRQDERIAALEAMVAKLSAQGMAEARR